MGKSRARKKREKEEEVNAAEVAMAKAVKRVQVILREHSEEEIRAMLLECNMNQNFAIDRLLSQQDAKNEQGASNQLPDSSTTTSSILVPNQSAITNGETTSVPISSSEAVTSLSVPSSSDVTNGETRSVPISSTEAVPSFSVPSSSDVTNSETKSVPISSNVALLSLPVPSTSDVTNSESRSVPISSTETVPPLSLPSSSDITNGETRSVTISSKAAAPSLSVPSSRAPTNVKTKRQQAYRIISASDPSWADLFKTPDATNRSSTESDAARRDQLQESALLIPNPSQNSAFPVNQPMDTTRRQQSTATASSPLGLGPPISMADLNSFFSSAGFQQRSGSNSYTSAHDCGDMTNLHYLWRQEQNNVPSSEALQQRGGTSNDTSLYQSLDSVFSQYRNNSLPPSATSSDMTRGTAANSSGTSSIGPSSYDSAYSVGMPSGNAAPWSGSIPRVHLPSSNSSGGTSSSGPSSNANGSNSRLGYGDYLPPVHLQQGSRSSNEWTVQSEEIYFIPSHWRSPGYRPSQQEREEYRGIGYERLRAYNASINQENSTSDPSDQTQQRPKDK